MSVLVERLRLVTASLAALVLLVGLGGCAWGDDAAVSELGGADDDGFRGAYLGRDGGHRVPAVTLTDTEGTPVDLVDGTKRSLVFFGFTRCTTVCPVVLSTLAAAVDRLPAAERDRLQVVFVTTDPAHDTAPVLRRHLAAFDPAFRGVTGTDADVRELADALQVPLDDGRGTVVASVADGMADLLWTRVTTPADLSDDLERILQESR